MEANNKVIRQGDVILIYVGDKKPAEIVYIRIVFGHPLC